jgi:pimeloyl-ACP methyl ester carboxylesterase
MAAMLGDVAFLEIGAGDKTRRIAYAEAIPRDGGAELTIVWLGGYRSDMSGTKAIAIDDMARREGLHFLRFDYSGHGVSSGHYTEGTISQWLEDTLAIIEARARRDLVLIASSMGGWIALRAIEALRERGDGGRVKGLLLIAPAPDFTIELIEPNLTEADRRSLADKGYFEESSDYSAEPNRFTRALIEDGRRNRVMSGLIDTGCPVHILQGMKDPDVPYQHALKIMDKIVADDAVLTLIRDGDHRLSRQEDLERILAALSGLLRSRR